MTQEVKESPSRLPTSSIDSLPHPSVSWRRSCFLFLLYCMGRVMRLLPRRRRYGAAFGASRSLLWIARRTEKMANAQALHVEADADIALGEAMFLMDRLGVAYDPRFSIDGYDILRDFASDGRGTLLVGAHALLTKFIPRAFADDAVDVNIVANVELLHIPGTTRWDVTIPGSPSMLLRVRSALRRGELVFALIDRPGPQQDRTTVIYTKLGEVHVADALLRVAEACGARTVFMTTTSHAGLILVRFTVPRSGVSAPSRELLQDFAATIIEHVERTA